jgi:archaellum component FlaC
MDVFAILMVTSVVAAGGFWMLSKESKPVLVGKVEDADNIKLMGMDRIDTIDDALHKMQGDCVAMNAKIDELRRDIDKLESTLK